ncbi:DUF934 domain-containing protein [Lichenihabitans sp. Uapishka_5]|uniref:DUF934 domain-containing protein n=1 Tax=Lichenihabitans sp. Uapishka_5 TaxID=3037302 RepID=UPI0029E7E23A|nr:DUF934 domain-containing protein [Lichenihabitans sp. Uapishka_5]MDX7952688.1 DUF934 domain-containing protein [Lichenihabitans sp. Uapishka_5]
MAYFKNGAPVDDPWQPLPEGGTPVSGVPTILPLKAWLEQRDALAAFDGRLGVRIEPGEALDPVVPDLDRLSLVALSFPKFADGRSFSKATMLREEHGFAGEVRAVGDVLWDQLQLMRRCGFDSFEITNEPTLRALEAGKKPFMSDFYQPGYGPEVRVNTPRTWARRAVG